MVSSTFSRAISGAVLTFGLSMSAAVALAEAELEFFSDSGIRGPAYATILETHANLVNHYPGWASTFDYGRTAEGRTLRAVRIQNPSTPEGENRPGVIISGSIHGNEYINIEDRLAGWFLANKTSSPGVMRYLNAGGVIYVIPILNPDGYEGRNRGNSNGVDLNRDFDLIPAREPNFKEAETSSLRDFLERELAENQVDLRVTVDYHCCDGSLLFPWSYTMNDLPGDILAGHNEIARLMNEIIGEDYRFGSTGQVLGYNPRGTSKDYFFAKYGALAFTFEGAYRQEDKNFDKHTLWWDHILAGLVAE
jgi:succinylglutamate desuccinylase